MCKSRSEADCDIRIDESILQDSISRCPSTRSVLMDPARRQNQSNIPTVSSSAPLSRKSTSASILTLSQAELVPPSSPPQTLLTRGNTLLLHASRWANSGQHNSFTKRAQHQCMLRTSKLKRSVYMLSHLHVVIIMHEDVNELISQEG